MALRKSPVANLSINHSWDQFPVYAVEAIRTVHMKTTTAKIQLIPEKMIERFTRLDTCFGVNGCGWRGGTISEVSEKPCFLCCPVIGFLRPSCVRAFLVPRYRFLSNVWCIHSGVLSWLCRGDSNRAEDVDALKIYSRPATIDWVFGAKFFFRKNRKHLRIDHDSFGDNELQ